MNGNFNQQQIPQQMAPQPPKKKKKGLLIAIIAIIAVVVIGCSISGGKDNSDTRDDGKKAITGSSEVSATMQSVSDNTESKSDASKEEKPKTELATISEQVCFEKNGIKVTAQSLEEEMFGGKYLKLLVENNSQKTYTVGCTALIVNNCMISDLFVAEVAAGKKSNEKMYLSSSDLEASGIDNIGQIEIYFHMYEGNEIMDSVDIDPVIIKTSAFDKMDAQPDDSGHELYNKDGLKIVGKYVDENSFWGKSVLLYIENKTGKKVDISSEDLSVNGFMITDYFHSTVYDNKYAIDSIVLSPSDLKDNNIDSIDEIELTFSITTDGDILHSTKTDAIKFSAKG